MNDAFIKILRSSDDERRALFETTASKLGTQAANVEKDLWVCWTLDFLFNHREDASVRMYFKGGTSLSKAFGLIQRFSEDIDVGVYKADINAPNEREIAKLGSATQQIKAIENRIDKAATEYFAGPLRQMLEAHADRLASNAGLAQKALTIDFGFDERRKAPQRDVLLLNYPSVFGDKPTYVTNAVRIEGGARPDPEPAEERTITPYVAGSLGSGLKLQVPGVMTVRPERTFWEKLLILHAMREMTDIRTAANDPKRLSPSLNRYSRHYYDIHQIWTHPDYGRKTAALEELAEECRKHKELMFRAPDHRYDRAVPGSYNLLPTEAMSSRLHQDYTQMSGMIFGPAPKFDEVMASVAEIANYLNSEFVPASKLESDIEGPPGPKLA